LGGFTNQTQEQEEQRFSWYTSRRQWNRSGALKKSAAPVRPQMGHIPGVPAPSEGTVSVTSFSNHLRGIASNDAERGEAPRDDRVRSHDAVASEDEFTVSAYDYGTMT
jgi:hypothetical protein